MLFQRCPRGGLVLLGSSVSTRVRALLSFLVRLGLVSMNGLTFASFSVVVGWSKCPCRTSIRAGYLGTGVSLAHLPRKLKLIGGLPTNCVPFVMAAERLSTFAELQPLRVPNLEESDELSAQENIICNIGDWMTPLDVHFATCLRIWKISISCVQSHFHGDKSLIAEVWASFLSG
ncbi:hypothetical protein EV401DRAFT_1265244 [Pisolithus croceorrhizus]|nr:hypothetical protein EV401DRAFT_1265244 [Pisolithus croceorrhizus]